MDPNLSQLPRHDCARLASQNASGTSGRNAIPRSRPGTLQQNAATAALIAVAISATSSEEARAQRLHDRCAEKSVDERDRSDIESGNHQPMRRSRLGRRQGPDGRAVSAKALDQFLGIQDHTFPASDLRSVRMAMHGHLEGRNAHAARDCGLSQCHFLQSQHLDCSPLAVGKRLDCGFQRLRVAIALVLNIRSSIRKGFGSNLHTGLRAPLDARSVGRYRRSDCVQSP